MAYFRPGAQRFVEADWYQVTQQAARQEENALKRHRLGESLKAADPRSSTPDLLRGADSRIGNLLSQAARQVGVSLTPPSARGNTPIGLGSSRFNLAEVKPVNVTPPRVTLPRITLPKISMNRGSSIGSQLQTGRNFTEGFGNSRFQVR